VKPVSRRGAKKVLERHHHNPEREDVSTRNEITVGRRSEKRSEAKSNSEQNPCICLLTERGKDDGKGEGLASEKARKVKGR